MRSLLIVCILIFVNFFVIAQKYNIDEKIIGFGFSGYVIKNLENEKNNKDEYKFRIIMDSTKQVIETDWIKSAHLAELRWLGEGWLAFGCGREFESDYFVIIFDGNTGRLSKPIHLYKAIDIKSELVLSYDEKQLYVTQIFTGKKIIVPLPDDIDATDQTQYNISHDSYFDNDSLFLVYKDNHGQEAYYGEEKLKKIKLDQNILHK